MIYLFLADGFEQIEALATLDILRRASIEVKTVSVSESKTVKSTLGVSVTADITADEVELSNDLCGIILPGGTPGASNLEKSQVVQKAIKYANDNNLLLAAICAAPFVLGHAGVLKDKQATCYPGFEKELFGADIQNESVCKCDNVITAKGAGVSIDFGLAVVEYFSGKEKADKIAENIQCK